MLLCSHELVQGLNPRRLTLPPAPRAYHAEEGFAPVHPKDMSPRMATQHAESVRHVILKRAPLHPWNTAWEYVLDLSRTIVDPLALKSPRRRLKSSKNF